MTLFFWVISGAILGTLTTFIVGIEPGVTIISDITWGMLGAVMAGWRIDEHDKGHARDAQAKKSIWWAMGGAIIALVIFNLLY